MGEAAAARRRIIDRGGGGPPGEYKRAGKSVGAGLGGGGGGDAAEKRIGTPLPPASFMRAEVGHARRGHLEELVGLRRTCR